VIGVSNLGKAFGERVLFEGATFVLNAGARYGLVGANGSGKTTLLKIVAGDEPATEGSAVIDKGARVGVLRQDRFLDGELDVLDLAMRGDDLVASALREEERITRGDGDPGRLHELDDVIRAHDGRTLEARAGAVLEGLGIAIARHRRPLKELSGGLALRVLVAQVLVGGPDVLLLDEPTNHLDILSIRWLEKFLANYRGCAVVISHDQRFLDNVATHVLDVDYETVTPYVGNYASFVKEKAARAEQRGAEIDKAEADIAHKKAYVDRFRYKASKAKQAQSRLKQIDKIEVKDRLETTRRAPALSFEPERPSGRDVLEVAGVSKAYGAHVVLKDVALRVERGDKLAVIGPNGLGKSTLLKILVGALDADAGEARWGHAAKVGYFPQDHAEVFAEQPGTPLTFLESIAPPLTPPHELRGQLGRVLLSGAAVDKAIPSLSGGEQARLLFAKLAVERPNVLVLDEPTNHLDLESIHALVAALQKFEGAVVFVSHDRFFVSEVATRVLELTPTGPRAYPGTYAEYLAHLGDDHLDADAVVLKAKAPGRAAPPPTAASWEAQKKERNRKNQLPARRDKVLAEIEALERKKKALVDGYADEGFLSRATPADWAAKKAEQTALDAKISALMTEWEQIEAELGSPES
jgi:ATPase subunit of ABC transporter with duplicated ATPase domains